MKTGCHERGGRELKGSGRGKNFLAGPRKPIKRNEANVEDREQKERGKKMDPGSYLRAGVAGARD